MTFITYFDFSFTLLFVLIWIGLVTFFRVKKKKSLVSLLFFTIFYVYFVNVLDYTLIQFQSLIILKYFIPKLMLQGETANQSINLVPLITLTAQDLKTSLLNILLMMPFGFGLPFITYYRMKKIVIIGTLFSIIIELLQFMTGYLARTTFRVADINDVIMNTIGVIIGYLLFLGFVRAYHYVFHHREISSNPVLQHISKRTQK